MLVSTNQQQKAADALDILAQKEPKLYTTFMKPFIDTYPDSVHTYIKKHKEVK